MADKNISGGQTGVDRAALDLALELGVPCGGFCPRGRLAKDGPKVGNDDERADRYMVSLFDRLADACENYGRTRRGGILRPGSGSAMYYVWLARGHAGMREPAVGATAEGRRKGEPFGANLAPSQGVLIRGPFSVLLS